MSSSPASARTGVLFGGPSPEHDVSILTGLQAARELTRAGREVVAFYWSKTGDFFKVRADLEASDFLEGVPKGAEELYVGVGTEGGFLAPSRMGRRRAVEVDVVVVCCHGAPGEDGTIQGVLDLAGVRYTGAQMHGASLGMDKLSFAGLIAASGLPVLPRVLLSAESSAIGFAGPYIVKPRFGGSSIGVEVVEDVRTATARLSANVHLRNGAVLEPYRPDLFDLNVAVRTWQELSLSAVERPLRSSQSGEILGYSDKYVGAEGMASAPRELPARISDRLDKALREAAAEVARQCDVRGVARLDFLSDGESFFVNEINTVPGSLARYLWVEPEVPFIALLDAMIDEALNRPPVRYSVAGADGSVLRQAGNIASKLG